METGAQRSKVQNLRPDFLPGLNNSKNPAPFVPLVDFCEVQRQLARMTDAGEMSPGAKMTLSVSVRLGCASSGTEK